MNESAYKIMNINLSGEDKKEVDALCELDSLIK